MKKVAIAGAVLGAALALVPAAADAAEDPGCPDRVAAAQKEFDDAIEAGRLRLIELGATQAEIDGLLGLVADNKLTIEEQNRARQMYEESNIRYDFTDVVAATADLAKLNRILHAADALDAARNAGCDVPDTRDNGIGEVEPQAPGTNQGASQVGRVPVGGVDTGLA